MTAIEFNSQVTGLYKTLELFTRRFTNDHDEALDLVQETVLKAFKYRDKYTHNTNLKAWLFTIMRNTFINNYRKASKMKSTIDTDQELYYLSVEDKSNFATPDQKLQYKEIENSIKKVKKDFRVPFEMHVQGYKYNEIADKLGIPLGTVKTRIFYARKEIQKHLNVA
jgi:RNA polymerase sigma factor (sigma-70 family)